MHVLVLPSWYKTPQNAQAGIFFQKHALSLLAGGHQVGIAYFDGRSPRTVSLRALVENRFQVTNEIEEGIPTVRLHGWSPGKHDMGIGLWVHYISKAAEHYYKLHGKPDVIHAQSGLYAGMAAAQQKERHGIPYLLTEHSSTVLSHRLSERQIPLYQRAVVDANVATAVSLALAKAMQADTGRSDISIVPNCIDFQFWSAHDSSIGFEPFTFISVGNLEKVKGFDTLIDAFAILIKNCPNAKLKIVGHGSLKTALLKQVSDLQLTSSIEFLGRLSHSEIRNLFQKAACYVCPSRFETFGVAVIEALAGGLPTVCTQCGGPEEFLTRDCGILCPTNDPESLASAMSRALQMDRQISSVEARKVSSAFSISNVGALLEAQLMHARSPQAATLQGDMHGC